MSADVLPLAPPTCSHLELMVMDDGRGGVSFECERCGEVWVSE